MSETKTMTREERMATESIGRLMAGMTLPAILAQIINILYSIIDRIYIGHMALSYTHLTQQTKRIVKI